MMKVESGRKNSSVCAPNDNKIKFYGRYFHSFFKNEIKKHSRRYSEYSQQRAFCSLRSFMAVLYAENRTLFKSAVTQVKEEKVHKLFYHQKQVYSVNIEEFLK